MPEISVAFSVNQPVDRVWSFMQDIPAVVSCVPGLELTAQTAPDTYQGRISLKLGPIAVSFEGEAVIKNVDAANRTAVIEGKGVDKRGGSRTNATFTYVVAATAEGTTVTTNSQFTLSGALAQMGRTAIFQDVAKALTQQFAQALSAKLAAAPASEASDSPGTIAANSASEAAAKSPRQQNALGLGMLLRILVSAVFQRFAGLFHRSAPSRE